MTKRLDLTGQRFGRYIALSYAGNQRWLCRCDCGAIREVSTAHLRDGHSKSCGCLSAEESRRRATKHGLRKHPLFNVWNAIRNRCSNPKVDNYKYYGGRGITICDEWRGDFQIFYDWAISSGWRPGLEIDRVDTNGNYEPSNCRIVNKIAQLNNKRTNRILELNGESHTLAEWARISGVKAITIHNRLKLGYSLEIALQNTHFKEQGMNKDGSNRLIEFNGECHTAKGWEKIFHIDHSTIKRRLEKGWPVEKALSKKPTNDNRKE